MSPSPRHLPLLLGLLAAVPWNLQAATPADCQASSDRLLQALQRRDAAALQPLPWSSAMQRAAPVDKLLTVWTQLQNQWGSYQDQAAPRSAPAANGGMAVRTPLRFARQPMDALVNCDAQGQIVGLHFVPPAADAEAEAGPALPAGLHQHPVQIPTPLGPLPGKLMLPEGAGPYPVVLLVAGSGPNDADESIGPNKPFYDLAVGLARAGIASLRYDKRTRTYASQMAGAPITTQQEVDDDALTALHLLLETPGIDPRRIYLLGHSEGAMLAPRIAQRAPGLAGVILLAAPARPLVAVLDEQLQRRLAQQADLSASQRQQASARLQAQIRQIEQLDPAHPPRTPLLLDIPASYWLSLRGYDAVASARTLTVPLLILQGGRDIQVSPQRDFGRWQQTFADDPRVRLIDYPTLSHLFMPAGDPPGAADYARPAQLDPQVIADISSWIRQHPATR